MKGNFFIVAKAGKPLVKVRRLDTPSPDQILRIGFMSGQIRVPEDFNRMHAEEVRRLFEGEE